MRVVTHTIAALIHHLASFEGTGHVALHGYPHLCEALPEARRLGLIEHPGDSELDRYHAKLTETGRRAALEGLCAMEEQT